MIFNKRSNTYSDEQLIQNYRDSNKKKWVGELWNRYVHLVFGLCLKYLKNKEKAEDATLEIFERLFVSLKEKEVDTFKKWIYTVSKNHCLMILRKETKFKGKIAGEEVLDKVQDEVDQFLRSEEDLQALELAIEGLNEDQQRCIKLFYIQEKSYKEVAAITGFDLIKVKSHIQNGKRNLKIQLSKNNE